MKRIKSEKKSINLSMPKEIWGFLKDLAKERESYMTTIILEELYKLKNKVEKK